MTLVWHKANWSGGIGSFLTHELLSFVALRHFCVNVWEFPANFSEKNFRQNDTHLPKNSLKRGDPTFVRFNKYQRTSAELAAKFHRKSVFSLDLWPIILQHKNPFLMMCVNIHKSKLTFWIFQPFFFFNFFFAGYSVVNFRPHFFSKQTTQKGSIA